MSDPAQSGSTIPLFASEPGVPRRRRASDVVRLLAAGATFVLLAWAASEQPEADARTARFFADLPGWIRSLSWAGYTTATLAALVFLVAAIRSRNERAAVARDLVCALATAVVLAIVSGRAATGAWPFVLPEIVDQPEQLPYPTMRTTLVLIVALVLGTYVNAGAQRAMRWMTLGVSVAPLLLGLTTLTALFGALALGLLSVAAVRIAFGSPEGLPSLERVTRGLEHAGIEVDDVAYRPDQPGTVGLATATTTDGRRLEIKVFGVDAASRQRAERIWQTLWYRSAGPSPRAGRTEQAEHEALAVFSARASGVEVPELVGAGQEPNGDVLLVAATPFGEPLDAIAEPTDGQLAALWTELHELHEHARITHGSISPGTLRLDGERVQLVDLSASALLPTPQQKATDLVSMLATQATAVGADRAVSAATDALDPGTLEASLPYVQEAVLEPGLRRTVKAAGIKMKDLGELIAGALEIDAPEPAPVRRVSWSNVFIAVAAVIAANALITQITDVGVDTLLDELRDASPGWLVTAFVVNLLATFTAYFGLTAVIDRPLPFFPVALLQSAKGFVGLVVPSIVGRVGLDIRFLQLAGVPVVVASTQGPVIGFIGFLAEVVLLAVSAWAIGQEIETDELGDFDGGGLIAIAIVVVIIGIVVVLTVPKLRQAVVPVVREAIGSVRSIVSSPATMVKIFGSEMADRLIKAVALGATVAAFGADLPFAALVFVSVGTGLLAGLAPVPGGIGVAEATMSGLLTATGLPPEQSVSIAIVHRVVTSYLPPVIGFFSFGWLKDKGYL